MNDHPAIAIPNLLYTYAMRFDDGDFAGAAALFDQGALIAQGHRIEGREAILAMWSMWVKTYESKPLTRHITTNRSSPWPRTGQAPPANRNGP